MTESAKKSPFRIPNVRLFIAFRVFFSARFYYPVFTILFLDIGLSLEQFAILNVAWAVTIVLLEVPSGALADIMGRRNLLLATGGLMVVEIALLCFAPLGRPSLIFALFLLNRILSGIAEAAASGADEALAYDSLIAEGDPEDWGRVLEVQMRIQSIAFIVAMSLGAAVYDPVLMQRLADGLSLPWPMTQETTLRFPLFLTLIMALLTLLTAIRMREPDRSGNRTTGSAADSEHSIAQAFKLTLQAGGWILRTPFALVLIVCGLLFDHIVRMVMTLSSQYYRLIDLPEASFGVIGSAMAVMGLFMPKLAHRLARSHSPLFNLWVAAAIALAGLWGMALFLPVYGLAPAFLLYSVMFMISFFLSHYLNRITHSDQRATVLSFKGLAFNLAYGAIGLLYALLLAQIRAGMQAGRSELTADGLQNVVFIEAFSWFPGYFVLIFISLLGFGWWQLRHSDDHKRVG